MHRSKSELNRGQEMIRNQIRVFLIQGLSCLLLSPISVAQRTLTKNTSDIAVVPLSLQSGLLSAILTLNGKADQRFLIDSGLSRSMLNSQTAKSLHLKQCKGTVLVEGIEEGDPQIANVYSGVKISYEHKGILRGSLPAMDMRALEGELKVSLAGIIGYDVLQAHRTLLSFSRLEWIINVESPAYLTPQTTVLHLRGSDSYPAINVSFSAEDSRWYQVQALLY